VIPGMKQSLKPVGAGNPNRGNHAAALYSWIDHSSEDVSASDVAKVGKLVWARVREGLAVAG
jgi:hypothetical protein